MFTLITILLFNKHVDAVCGNITSKVAHLNRIKQFLLLHAKKLYFNAYILPIIDYCPTIWGNVSKSQIERINKLQKRVARIILDAPPDSPSLPLILELGWLTISERIDQARIQEFSSGGVQPSEKILIRKKKKKKKKKKKTTKGEREGFSIYSALVWSKSNLAIEIAFKIIFFHKMTSPVFSSHPKHI